MNNFRYDINGLRAWAVLAVVFYHYNIFSVTGGYAGVDVFFVISGFLMTKIISDKLMNSEPHQFSLLEFYLFRAKRIIPPLLVVSSCLLILGYYILLDDHYYTLSSHILRAHAFTSNFKFLKESGYFDAAANTKWLLHTWSLSVEWQFYLIYPLLLMAAYRLSATARSLKLVLLFAALLSFVYSIIMIHKAPEFSFYMLPTRAWELLAGGVVYLFLDHWTLKEKQQVFLEYLGFILIFFSFFVLTKNSAWPGFLAIIPVLGTSLVIIAKRTNSIWSNNRVLQYLGTISYSLYLWHWPVYVFLVYYELEQRSSDLFLALIVVLLCAHLSYTCIERPSKYLFNKKDNSRALLLLCSCVLVFLMIPGYIKLHRGLVNPLVIKLQNITKEAKNKNPRELDCEGLQKAHPDRPSECIYGGSKLGVILLGDSHASAIVLALQKALPDPNLHVLDWSILGCPASLEYTGASAKYKGCALSNRYFLEKNRSLPKKIPLVMANYTNDKDRMNMACEMAKSRSVYLLRPTPQFNVSVPFAMARNIFQEKKNIRLKLSIANDYKKLERKYIKLQDAAAKECGVKILETIPYLCMNNYCYGDYNGMPIYYDDHHLNLRGADLLIPELKKIFT